MKNQKDKNETEYNFYFDQWEQSHDPEFAIKIMQMIQDKKLQVKAMHQTDSLGYKPHSQWKMKCCKCGKYYLAGAPCFYQGKLGWHEECASEQDKQLPYYIKCKENEAKQAAPATKPTPPTNKPAYQIRAEREENENELL